MEITPEQLKKLIDNAPPGVDREQIIPALRARGHTIRPTFINDIINQPKPKISLFEPQASTAVTPNFMERVGQRVIERRKNVEDILGAEQSPASSAFQTVGQAAGLATDVSFEILKSVAGKLAPFVPEQVKDSFKKIGESALETISKSDVGQFLRDWQEAKEASPEFAEKARNIEAVLNIGALGLEFQGIGEGARAAVPLAKRGAQVAAETAGEAAGKVAGKLESKLAVKDLEKSIEIGREPINRSVKEAAMREGRATTRFGGQIEVAPSKFDQQIGEAIQGFIDVNAKPEDNIKALREGIVQRSRGIREAMRKSPGIFNEAELRSRLMAVKDQSKVVFGSDKTLENAYDAVVDEFMRHIKNKPHTFEGLYDARIEFDQFMRKKFPKAFEDLGDSPRYNAVRDVRRAANELIGDRMPAGEAFRGVLRQESLMYDAIDNISAKAVQTETKGVIGAANKIVDILRKHPVQVATAFGVGAGTLLGILTSPIAIGTLVTTGAYQIGKKVLTSDALKSGLSKTLRFMEDLLKTSDEAAKKVIQQDIENIQGFIDKIKPGLTIEDVTKGIPKVPGAAGTPETALTTKFLEYAKDKTVLSRQEILDFARRPELKRGEADLLNNLAKGLPEGKFSAQEFTDSIRRDLLELKPVKVENPQYMGTTIQRTKELGPEMYGNRSKSASGFNYEEVVFESPIKTNGSSHYPNSRNYFAHARGDEVIESGKKIWREQEIQSDLLQKDKLENMQGVFKGANDEQAIQDILAKNPTSQVLAEAGERQRGILKLSPFTNDRFGERIMRERIREKAQKGYDKYRLPTGETIGKIEGFESPRWFENPTGEEIQMGSKLRQLTPRNLKVGMIIGSETQGDAWVITDILGDGRFKAVPKDTISVDGRVTESVIKDTPDALKETFDLTGRSNPQSRRYQDWGKFLKNKFGGKEVTDPQGNTWMEIDLKKEHGKMPVEAFGLVPLIDNQDNNA
jgi:hypothetical protein